MPHKTTSIVGTWEGPFAGNLPNEIPLPRSPLVRVLAQVRFPIVAAVETATFIASFQEAVRSEYPIMRQERTRTVLFQDGDPDIGHRIVWRFSTLDRRWRLSVAPDFLALETRQYESRSGFMERLAAALEALEHKIKPGAVDRIGLRYIDQLKGEALERLEDFVRPEILGVLPSATGLRPRSALSESRFQVRSDPTELLTAKWGLVPANETFDPGAFEPVDEETWVLDLDMFSPGAQAFNLEQLVEQVEGFAQQTYSFFRWVVTNDFLEYYGGVL